MRCVYDFSVKVIQFFVDSLSFYFCSNCFVFVVKYIYLSYIYIILNEYIDILIFPLTYADK